MRRGGRVVGLGGLGVRLGVRTQQVSLRVRCQDATGKIPASASVVLHIVPDGSRAHAEGRREAALKSARGIDPRSSQPVHQRQPAAISSLPNLRIAHSISVTPITPTPGPEAYPYHPDTGDLRRPPATGDQRGGESPAGGADGAGGSSGRGGRGGRDPASLTLGGSPRSRRASAGCGGARRRPEGSRARRLRPRRARLGARCRCGPRAACEPGPVGSGCRRCRAR